jgi:hypothetical protein
VVVEDLGEHQMMLNQVDLVVVEAKGPPHQLVEHQELQIKVMLVEEVVQKHQHLAAEVVLEVLAQHQWLVVRV